VLDTLQGLLEVVSNIVMKEAKPRSLTEKKGNEARYGGKLLRP
jgi:hypothetical protein